VRLQEPRDLTETEARTVRALLALEFPGVVELRAQLSHARVVGRCDCGCPTVDLLVSEAAPRSPVETRARLAPVEGLVAADEEGLPGEIILFVDDGRLSSLEYVSYSLQRPSQWPSLDQLTIRRTD
jgi:hypothetical protein